MSFKKSIFSLWIILLSWGASPLQAAPAVWINTPVDGTSHTGKVGIYANVSSLEGITRAEFILDESIIIGGASSPGGITPPFYYYSWNTSYPHFTPGWHTLQAKVFASDGSFSVSPAISVFVNKGVSGSHPLIELTQSASRTVVPSGEETTFTIHFQNIGPALSAKTVIKNILPTGVALVPGSITAPAGIAVQFANNTITWNAGSVSAGAEGSVSFRVTVSADFTNRGSVDYEDEVIDYTQGATYTGGSNPIAVTVSGAGPTLPNINLSKSATPASVSPGGEVTFTLTYSNSGGSATHGVITDTVPAGSTLVAGSITGPGASVSGNTITWSIGNIAAGAPPASVSFKVTAN